MPINWDKIIPRWSGDVIEPPEAKKDTGYIAGDKPPAKWENWLRKGTYEALEETRTVVEGIDSQLAQDVLNLITHQELQGINAHGLSGKIINSSGSNTNGNWIRFEDGTQICYNRLVLLSTDLNISLGTIFRSVSLSWTYPSAFLNGTMPTVSGLIGNSTFAWIISNVINGTNVGFYLASPISNTGLNYILTLQSIGRWR